MAIQQQQTSGELTLLQAIDMVAKDKGIDKGRLIKTVEEAILKAAQSVFGINREMEARFNEDSGQVDLFQYMTVVDDVSDDEREIASRTRRRSVSKRRWAKSSAFRSSGTRTTPRRRPSRTKSTATFST